MAKTNSKITAVFLALVVSVTVFTQSKATEIKESISIPKAKKERYEKSIHGNIIVDDYDWLKDKNWPKVDNPHK